MEKPQGATVIILALWLAVLSCGLISHLIGHRTIKMSKSNQSVHGFGIRTVSTVSNFKSLMTKHVMFDTKFGLFCRVSMLRCK